MTKGQYEEIDPEMENEGISPTPQNSLVVAVEKEMNFTEALAEVMDGQKITRTSWNNDHDYGIIRGDMLLIHKSEDGKDHPWIVNVGDIEGKDWKVIKNVI